AGGFVVDFGGGDGLAGEDGELVVFHLGDAAFDVKVFFFARGQVDAQGAQAKLDEQRGAVGEDADQAIVGGEDGLGDGLGEHLVLGGDNVAVEGHRAGESK